jgi:hypothetical protein
MQNKYTKEDIDKLKKDILISVSVHKQHLDEFKAGAISKPLKKHIDKSINSLNSAINTDFIMLKERKNRKRTVLKTALSFFYLR